MSRALLLCLVTALSIASLSSAQNVPSTESVARELQVISERAGRAVTLLEELVGQRSEELGLRRLQVAVLVLQLRSNAIGEIEARIQTLQDRVTEAGEYSTQIESEIEHINDVLTADTTSDEEKTQLESSRNQLDRQIELTQQRVWSLERQILDLENEIAAKRRDVDSLEEIVMEGLSGF